MYDQLAIFRTAASLATHAAARQSAVAQNIANADTPGYKARDVPSFADTYQRVFATPLRASRAGHFLPGETAHQAPDMITATRPGAQSPNGNTVSLESEMMKAAEVKRDHDLAITIYQTSLGILRSSLGRAR